MVQYYYTDGKERFGPFTLEELRAKSIKGNTLVWKEGLPDWVPASQLSDLSSLFPVEQPVAPAEPQSYQSPLSAPPKNWLIESILVTIFCCLPLGIVGIILSMLVDSFWREGNQAVAIRLSAEAGKWVKLGFIFGLVAGAIYFFLVMFGVISGIGSGIEV